MPNTLELTTYLEQLLHIFNGAVWDGNLISKSCRDKLETRGLIQCVLGGWNIITPKGAECIIQLGLAIEQAKR